MTGAVANAWLFHAVNDVRGEAIDALMRLGTTLADSNRFAPYLALIALAAAVHVVRVNARDPSAAVARTIAWLGVIVVFAFAYVLGSYLLA